MLDGALSYISLLSSASLIFSPSIDRTPHLLHRMAVHLQHGLGYIVGMRSNKPKGQLAARYILEGLPTVGPKAAQSLLEHFGSPRWCLLQRGTSCFRFVLGPKSADAILAALA